MPHIYSVSELNRQIRFLLEDRFPFLSVSGEIANLRKPYSGHLYFTLKDNQGQIKAVLFKMQQRYLPAPLQDGQQVVCRGRISVYEPRGEYQLIVDTVDCKGAGDLHLAYEQLKKKLAAEKLFDQAAKQPLPTYPGHITLITSPDGAAVHDFVKIAGTRFPFTRLFVYPTAVQGPQAAGELIKAIQAVNKQHQTDIIVLCRGGGSIEDLWCFNDEQLARTIHASRIPIVSAVGHEIDFTIADFVADLRAPTPSGAAEMLLPDQEALKSVLEQHKRSLLHLIKGKILGYSHRLTYCQKKFSALPHPINNLLLRVSHLGNRLERSITLQLSQLTSTLDRRASTLKGSRSISALHLQEQHIQTLSHKLAYQVALVLEKKTQQLNNTAAILDAVSPLATLSRGYAIARKTDARKTVITREEQVKAGEKIHIQVHHGIIPCRVEPD